MSEPGAWGTDPATQRDNQTDEHKPVWIHLRDATELGEKRSRAERVRDWLLGRTPAPDAMPNVPLIEPVENRVGICCSGGGVRSASYNLGALQVLREEGVLGDAKYISAVSGGSYIAAAYAGMTSAPPVDQGEPIYAPGSPEEEYLRNHSSYLAPGLGGKARLLLRVLLGMVVNLLFVGLAVAIVSLPLGWLSRLGYPQLARHGASGGLNVDAWMWLAPTLPAAIAIACAVPDLLFHFTNDDLRRFLEAWTARLMALGLVLAVLLLLVPQVLLLAREVGHANPTAVVEHLRNVTPEGSQKPSEKATGLLQSINLGAILTAIAGALRAFVARKRSYFALLAAAVAGPLVVVTPALWLFNQGAVQGPHESAMVWGLIGAAALAGVLWLVADLTQWSLHPFYRRRLSSAFFLRRVRGAKRVEAEEIPYENQIRISKLQYRPGQFPDLIVCASANVSDEGATPPGRWATPFTFSRLEIGGPIGALRAVDYENATAGALRTITLPAAVAMSGAAVSPEMGKKTIRALSFLLALTNVRLGVWVPNPRRVDGLKRSRFELRSEDEPDAARATGTDQAKDPPEEPPGWFRRRRPTPLYLFKELFGWTSVKDRFLYITDGGHYDNLGLIELLRRGCTTIFCLDAGGDPSGTYSSLGEAVALARSDLQVDIKVDPTPIKPGPDRIAPQDSVVGRYRFCATREHKDAGSDEADEHTQWMGELVYCRAAVTADAPWDVKAFHESDKRFPYHSTFDQLFNDQKFESYRALGAHTVRKAVVARHNRLAREEIRRILIEIARLRTTITTANLLVRADQHLLAARLTTIRPLLEEIGKLEEAERRPEILLVIHEGGHIDDATNARLEVLWDYWRDAPDPL
jgi:Patatin-like phospholipase